MAEEKKKSAKSADEQASSTRMRIKVRAFDHRIVDEAAQAIIQIAERNNSQIAGPVPLPTEKRKYTVNRSTFVHKRSREQFEIRVHKRLIDIIEPTQKAIEAMMGLHLPSGVDVEIKM